MQSKKLWICVIRQQIVPEGRARHRDVLQHAHRPSRRCEIPFRPPPRSSAATELQAMPRPDVPRSSGLPPPGRHWRRRTSRSPLWLPSQLVALVTPACWARRPAHSSALPPLE